MSKVICEICGTVYPDNATSCPICGCSRTSEEEISLAEEEAAAAGAVRTTQRVKGGRFSNKNVRKRNQAANAGKSRRSESKEGDSDKEPSNRGLVITVLILLTAVIFLVVFIGFRFFGDRSDRGSTRSTTQATAATQDVTTAPQDTTVACTDLDIGAVDLNKGVQLTEDSRAWRMTVRAIPEDTTDEITYEVDPEGVVDLSADGVNVELKYLAPGSAKVTIACGEISKTFTVVCKEPEPTETTTEPTQTTETEPEETTEPTQSGKLSLNSNDFTLFSKGETAKLTPGKGISPAQCTWTSGDESVATVDNGNVKAVAPGMTTITVEFNGQKETCIVRCNWTDETQTTEPVDETEPVQGTEPDEPSGDDEPTEDSGKTWKISHSDVTIAVGESFNLSLGSTDGETASVSWSASSDGVTISGNTVTGTASGMVYVTCTHDGVTYQCIVRVN